MYRSMRLLFVSFFLLFCWAGITFAQTPPASSSKTTQVPPLTDQGLPKTAQDLPGVSLQKPALINDGTTSAFPASEAGMAIYYKASPLQSVVWNDVKTKSSTGMIEQGPTHIIFAYNTADNHYPYTYINKDGWIIIYYLRDQEACHIFGVPGVLGTVWNLSEIQKIVTNWFTQVYSEDKLGFYNFEYPNATGIISGYQNSLGYFTLDIPSSVSILDISYYLNGEGHIPRSSTTIIFFDPITINGEYLTDFASKGLAGNLTRCPISRWGKLPAARLTTGSKNTIYLLEMNYFNNYYNQTGIEALNYPPQFLFSIIYK